MDTARTLHILESEEGFRPAPYLCSEGKRTIGIGYNLDARKPPVWWDGHSDWTHQQAIFQLQDDLGHIIIGLDENLPWWRLLNDARQAVLVSMAFQMGLSGLLGFRTTLRTIADARYEEAAGYMLQSKWAKQTPKRARRHSKQMRTGEWHDYA
jgi:lysozyme